MLLNTSTAAPSGNSLLGANNWDLSSLELFAIKKRFTQCGSPSKTILSSSGGLETEGSGASGFKDSKTKFCIVKAGMKAGVS
jgi:hypothetical protein